MSVRIWLLGVEACYLIGDPLTTFESATERASRMSVPEGLRLIAEQAGVLQELEGCNA